MERLTRKAVDNINYVFDKYIALNEPLKSIANKLGKYEDLDEKLGIELPVLIKALTQPIAIKDDAGKITVMWAYPSLKINILDKRESWIMYGMEDDIEYLNVRDYGKTWALTKEELEK